MKSKLSQFVKPVKTFFEGHFLYASPPHDGSTQLCPSPLRQFLHHWQQHRHQRQRPHGLLLPLRRLQRLPLSHPDGKVGRFSPEHQMLLLDQSLLFNSARSGKIIKISS